MKALLITASLFLAIQAHALKFDSSVPAAIQTQMVEDLAFMAQLTGNGATPFHKEIFGQVDGPTYKNFFETRITSVGLDSCGGGPAVACVQPFFDPNKMWLTQNFIKFSHPQIARLMIVYHESRHSETKNGNWMHDTCPRPFLGADGKDMVSIWTGAKLEAQPACDSTYKGSYGSSTVMLANVSKFCANCSDKVKMDANIYATDQLGRIDRPDVKKAMIADFATN
ncbi:MAG: hypothetical protein H7256_04210 [Bdellovibrio sp.]|nr:hypothetical protein [Bdellovibrio sp.]